MISKGSYAWYVTSIPPIHLKPMAISLDILSPSRCWEVFPHATGGVAWACWKVRSDQLSLEDFWKEDPEVLVQIWNHQQLFLLWQLCKSTCCKSTWCSPVHGSRCISLALLLFSFCLSVWLSACLDRVNRYWCAVSLSLCVTLTNSVINSMSLSVEMYYSDCLL